VLASLRDAIAHGPRGRFKPDRLPEMVKPELRPPPTRGLRVTWLGHSTSIVDIDGHRVLLDPVFGDRASPFRFVGPKRFHPPPLALKAIADIDVVVITHDHYDHLDHPTVVQLAKRGIPFVTSLGVGAHLEHWGVPTESIVELDWWEETSVGGVTVTATPSRHFSGRLVSMRDRFHTLWSGMALRSEHHAVFFSGDTAMFSELREIGERLGPFDMALVEAGAYCAHWRDVHIGPEQAVVASELVRAELLMPVHWGTFDLALHGWTEPAERVWRAAQRAGVALTTPRLGETVEPGVEVPLERWWPERPWQSAAVAPIVSTGLDAEIQQRVEWLSDERGEPMRPPNDETLPA